MLLVGSDLDEVRADGWVNVVGVVETLWVVDVGNIKLRNVVAGRGSEIGVLAIFGDIGEKGDFGRCIETEIVEQLDSALVATAVAAKRVDDPDLAEP